VRDRFNAWLGVAAIETPAHCGYECYEPEQDDVADAEMDARCRPCQIFASVYENLGSARTIAIVLGEMKHNHAARDLDILREAGIKLMFPILTARRHKPCNNDGDTPINDRPAYDYGEPTNKSWRWKEPPRADDRNAKLSKRPQRQIYRTDNNCSEPIAADGPTQREYRSVNSDERQPDNYPRTHLRCARLNDLKLTARRHRRSPDRSNQVGSLSNVLVPGGN
jgi:hypothetical protein